MVRSYTGERERVNFYFDKELFEALKILARLRNTTYSELIRQACREYIARHTAQSVVDKENLKELKDDNVQR